MHRRDIYLNQLISFRGKQLIKVITGVRRSGKSALMDLYEEYLLANGVSAKSIIRINFESVDFNEIQDYLILHEYIKSRLKHGEMTYILLDEVQLVPSWEKAVNSIRLIKNTDIYITGSNAWLLSSELSTLLSGRYVEIKLLPLSFKEYLGFNGYGVTGDLLAYFNRYIKFGAFPGITELRGLDSSISALLNGIYNTIIVKDVVQRGSVRDPALLERLAQYMAGNIGNITSTKKISDTLTSYGQKTTSETIDNYINLLENAYIIYRARRFDLKGKSHLKTHEKFYFIDTGIRNELVGYRGDDYGFVLENIVYFELIRRGYQVSVGKIGDLEVDFAAVKPDKTIYYQVCATMLTDEVKERELRPLEKIPDHYEKVVLSMDRTPMTDYNGIRNVNLIDFLLS